ncbi:MAG: flavin reductase family protein [Pacificimonas sp.]
MTDDDFDPKAFRAALGSFATGVTVVTTVDANGNDVGLTANSFNSVSLDPPMVLWSLARASRNLPVFSDADRFAVHVLASDQRDLSTRFATSGEDKFAGVDVSRGPDGIPLLSKCAARFICATAHQYDGGDHVIFVGEVTRFSRSALPPLLYHGGDYAMASRMAGDGDRPLDLLADEVRLRLDDWQRDVLAGGETGESAEAERAALRDALERLTRAIS